MSYIICDIDCDLEINKSVLEEHCPDCLCEPGGVPLSVPASKAWRHTSVVGERRPAQSLPSRRSHRRKKTKRNSGRLNRGKVKRIRRINRRWRWKNKWRIKRLKSYRKQSQRMESPGKISIEGTSSPNLEARDDDETGSLELDLTANTESTDTVKRTEDAQYGTQEIYLPKHRIATGRKMSNQLRKAIVAFTRSQAPPQSPLYQGGAHPPSLTSSSGWLDAEGEQQYTQRQRANYFNTGQTLEWSKEIGEIPQKVNPQAPTTTGENEEPTLVGPERNKREQAITVHAKGTMMRQTAIPRGYSK